MGPLLTLGFSVERRRAQGKEGRRREGQFIEYELEMFFGFWGGFEQKKKIAGEIRMWKRKKRTERKGERL